MSRDEHTLPERLRPLADRLDEVGRASREEGAGTAERVAMRTAHLLGRPSDSTGPISRLQRALLWLAGPAAVVATGLIGFALLRPGVPPAPTAAPGADMLAANLEHDIDALLELDAMWRRDAFESRLALLSLEAADAATRTEDLAPLPAIDAGS